MATRNCAKGWKVLHTICPRLSEKNYFRVYFFPNGEKLQKWSALSRKSKNLLINAALLQTERLFLLNLCVTLKCILGLCRNSVALNINCKSKWVFLNTKIYRKRKLQVALVELDMKMLEAVVQRCSVKKLFLEISQNLQENTCVRVFFNKVAGLVCNFIKKEILT